MFGTFSINSDSDKYSLTANYDLEKNEFYMPSLSFNYIKDKDKSPIVWDNPDFLYDNFLLYLNRALEGNVGIKDKLEFAPVVQDLEKDDVVELIEILEKGRELGWDKL